MASLEERYNVNVKKLLNKQVHIEFFNEKTCEIEWVEGIFSDFVDDNTEEDYYEQLNASKKIFIEVRKDFSYIFTDIIYSDWGGLPIESRKKIAIMDVGRLNDLLAGFLLMRRGSVIYPILFDLIEKDDDFEKRISNWKEIAKYTSFFKFNIRRIKIKNILSQISEETEKYQKKIYTCGICRLIRFEILSKMLNNLEDNELKYIKAITDGVSLIKSSFCSDKVDLKSISLNHMFSAQPIFTPIISFDLNKYKDFLGKIFNNLEKIDYCPLMPKEQEIDIEELKKYYESLNFDKLIVECLKNVEIINIM